MNFLEDKNKKIPDIYLRNLPTFTSGAIKNIAYGNGKFVAIAGTSSPYQLLTSDDGINWSVSSFLPATLPWTGLFFGNGMFIVSNGSGYPAIGYSYDGINWNYGNGAFSVGTYGNGKFVGLQNGQVGEILRISTNGINFTQYPSSVLSQWFSSYNFIGIEYQYSPANAHMFVAMGQYASGNPIDTARIAFSSDGENWQKIDTPVSSDWVSIASGNGKFVIISRAGSQIIYSENGTTWSVASRPSGTSFLVARKIIFSNGKFYIFGSNAGSLPNYCLVSSDGINWSTLNLTNQYANWSLAATNNETIVMLPDGVGSGGVTQIIGLRSGRFKFTKQTRSKYYGDPYFDKVALLLDFENGLKDESKYNHAITTFGDLAVSESDKKFGAKSLQLETDNIGANSNKYLEIENTYGAFNLGNQDFTIECWVRATNNNYIMPFVTFLNSSNAAIHRFGGRFSSGPGGGGSSSFTDINNNAYSLNGIYIPDYNTNLWYHYAVVRGNGKLYFYINGVLQTFSSGSSNLNFLNINQPLQNIDKIWINRAFTFIANYVNGYMDNIRITVGHARYVYPNNFAPEDFPEAKNKKVTFSKN